MDEPVVDAVKGRKGVILTMDSLFALALLLLSILFVLVLLNRQAQYRATGLESAIDIVSTLKALTLEELRGNPRYPYTNRAVIGSGLTSSYNETLIETLADLYLGGNVEEARNMSRELIGPIIPSPYGVELLVEKLGTDCSGAQSNFSCVYSAPRGASRNAVHVGRHFVYYNNKTREIRLVLYK